MVRSTNVKKTKSSKKIVLKITMSMTSAPSVVELLFRGWDLTVDEETFMNLL